MRAATGRWGWASIWDYNGTGGDKREVRAVLRRRGLVARLGPVDDLSEAGICPRWGIKVNHDEKISAIEGIGCANGRWVLCLYMSAISHLS